MTVVSLLCFAIALAIILSCLRRGADILSPARVFGFIWSVSIGLADLKLSRLQHDWDLVEWILLLTGVSSFLIGISYANMLDQGDRHFSLKQRRLALRARPIEDRVLFRLIVITFLIYAVSFSASVWINGFVPLFSRNPTIMRTKFTVFGIGLLNHAAPSILFFIVQYIFLVKDRRPEKITLGIVFLTTVTSYFLLLQRFDFAIAAVVSLVFMYYSSNVLRVRNVVVIGLVFVGLFYGISSIRLVGHIANYGYIVAKMKFPVQYAFITEPYMYIVTNLENFVHAASRLDQFTLGYYTFDFITALTGLKHWVADYYQLVESPYMISGYNTYTFLWPFYRDFGILGLLLLPLVEGFIISRMYSVLRRDPSILRAAMYGIAVFVMLISFFNHAPSLLHFVFNMGLIYFVNRSVMRQPVTNATVSP
ncbi:MAG TPA: O-antigen polymerase [Bacteroidota bacterium]